MKDWILSCDLCESNGTSDLRYTVHVRLKAPNTPVGGRAIRIGNARRNGQISGRSPSPELCGGIFLRWALYNRSNLESEFTSGVGKNKQRSHRIRGIICVNQEPGRRNKASRFTLRVDHSHGDSRIMQKLFCLMDGDLFEVKHGCCKSCMGMSNHKRITKMLECTCTTGGDHW